MSLGRTEDIIWDITRQHPHDVPAMSETDVVSGHPRYGLMCRHFDVHRTLKYNSPGTKTWHRQDILGMSNFLKGCNSIFWRPAQRYDDFKLIRITFQAACHGKTEHGIFVKFKKPAKLLSSYLPVAPSQVLRAPGTSPYHLVPKHLRTTWFRPEQSHLLPEVCSPNGTDKRRQRQRQTERPPPEPSDILKRFCTLYDDISRYYMKKVSKLYCSYNPFNPNDSIWSHWILDEI